jgi:hypothetical protein
VGYLTISFRYGILLTAVRLVLFEGMRRLVDNTGPEFVLCGIRSDSGILTTFQRKDEYRFPARWSARPASTVHELQHVSASVQVLTFEKHVLGCRWIHQYVSAIC